MVEFNPLPVHRAYPQVPTLTIAQFVRRQELFAAAREEAEREDAIYEEAKLTQKERERDERARIEEQIKKQCSSCRKLLPPEAFNKHAGAKDGLSRYCRKCRQVMRKAEYDPEKSFASYVRRRYGISVEEYRSRFEAQAGCCAICGVHAKYNAGRGEMLCLDHHHKTGELRGMLCNSCNTALGHFRDSPTILRGAIAYLDHYGIR